MLHIKVTELCESLLLPFLCLPLAIYSKQHQTSFTNGQGHLLFVILTCRLNAKANLKDHLLLLPCLYYHPPTALNSDNFFVINSFKLILMQVLYLVEVLLMIFDLLTFGNSQQVNDCCLVLIITYLLQWNPLQSVLHLELIFVPNGGVSLSQGLLVHFW